MKATVKLYSVLLFTLSFFIASSAIAGGGEEPMVEKKKTYSKSYPLSASDKVDLENSFGELKITTWDKSEVKVDVTMTGKGNTDEIAQEILDKIKIEDAKNGSTVYFKTKIDNDDNDWKKGDKERHRNSGFSIDYVVYLPSKTRLDATNQFGPMSIVDYTGEVRLESKFGSLTTGKLSNAKNVEIEFGKGSIASMNGGDLSIKFSRAEIKNLDGDVRANFEHSGVKIALDNSLKGLNIKNNFTELKVDVSKNLSANFDVHTNFSELKNKTDFNIKEEKDEDEDRHGPKFDRKYSGKVGSGSLPIKIRSEFGDVIIGHNLSFDLQDDDKDKEKDKGKKTRSV